MQLPCMWESEQLILYESLQDNSSSLSAAPIFDFVPNTHGQPSTEIMYEHYWIHAAHLTAASFA